MPLFHYALNTPGILLLGTSETVGDFTSLFNPLDLKTKIYTRINTLLSLMDIEFPLGLFPAHDNRSETISDRTQLMTKPITNLQTLADYVLLQHFAPAAVMVTAGGDIFYISGRTGKYLEPAAGKANWNLHAMAREGLRHELGTAMKKAKSQIDPVHVPNLTVGTNGGKQTFDLTVQLITTPEALNGSLMVVFTDVKASSPAKPHGKQPKAGANQKAMQAELHRAYSQVQSLREEMQSSQEELMSTNEELQSTNEELQSTNEELTTSKEEMQSLNEELQMVNCELQSKVDALSSVNNDMENLLNSTEIAMVFLDSGLHVRRFTDHATDLFKLIPTDIGRLLSDVACNLVYETIQQDAKTVLKTLEPFVKQVPTKDARWFKVRIMPYRTHDNLIDGVVMTFLDITERELTNIALRDALALLQRDYSDQTIKLDSANNLESLLNKAQLKLKQRIKDQAAKLDIAQIQETTREKERLVQVKRYDDQSMELDQAKIDLKSDQPMKKK
jgi:chemotaxis protein methyltransferase CheR/two-component system CheB/CheR fusion protein